MAKEANLSLKELTLGRFEFEMSFCQFLKDPLQMDDMFLGHPGRDNGILQIKDTSIEMQIS